MAKKSTRRILLLNGPNLNLLGTRQPELYGSETLKEIEARLAARAKAAGVDFESYQSNHEGALIDRLHEARGKADIVLLNPGALSHTSIALRDAITSVSIPTIEVHLSNIHAREEFRHHSHVSGVARGIVIGFGGASYDLALEAALRLLDV